MAYIPGWKPRAEALKRALAPGLAEDEAKADVCRERTYYKIAVAAQVGPSVSLRAHNG